MGGGGGGGGGLGGEENASLRPWRCSRMSCWMQTGAAEGPVLNQKSRMAFFWRENSCAESWGGAPRMMKAGSSLERGLSGRGAGSSGGRPCREMREEELRGVKS